MTTDATPRLAAIIRATARLAVAYVVGISLLVLAGWTWDVELLRSFLHPDGVAMNPLTAITFILCAASLWLQRDEKLEAPARGAARALAAAAVAAALVVLAGMLLGWDAHIDESLFRAQLIGRVGRNRMAPNTAISFLLVGAALLFLDAETRNGLRPAQLLTLVAGCTALLALTGYAFRFLSFYLVADGYVPMALNTALSFTVLCLGILCARVDREPMRSLASNTVGGIMARRLLPAAYGVPLALGWLRLRGEQAGLYRPQTGLSLFALSNILAFNVLIWWNARLLYLVDDDRRRAEEKLHEQNLQLEQAARAERQAMDALRAAQGHLVQNEKLAGLGQMVAGVAHEINNPLAFVSNNVAVLQRDVQPLTELLRMYQRADAAVAKAEPELMAQIADLAERVDLEYSLENVHDLLARSREGLRRIQQIVSDLRDFARLDESDLHEVDLNDGVRSTVNIIGARATKKRVRVVADLVPLPPVACYPAKINQVVMNLLANAIDASPDGGEVTVRTSPDGDGVQIEVADSGCGMPPAVRDKIFDPFFTTKPQGEGTGLGLSISYGIVRDHGGQIEVDSAPGQGARFTVRLPLRPPVE